MNASGAILSLSFGRCPALCCALHPVVLFSALHRTLHPCPILYSTLLPYIVLYITLYIAFDTLSYTSSCTLTLLRQYCIHYPSQQILLILLLSPLTHYCPHNPLIFHSPSPLFLRHTKCQGQTPGSGGKTLVIRHHNQ